MHSIDYFIDMYKCEFPEHKYKVDQHIELYGTFLGHIFFDEEISGPLCQLLRKPQNSNDIIRFVKIIEKMLFNGDDYVQSVAIMNIINTIKSERDLVEAAEFYFTEDAVDVLRSAYNEE